MAAATPKVALRAALPVRAGAIVIAMGAALTGVGVGNAIELPQELVKVLGSLFVLVFRTTPVLGFHVLLEPFETLEDLVEFLVEVPGSAAA